MDWLALAADTSHDLRDDAALRGVYSTGPGETSLAKVADHVHALYRPYIEASPFAVLATVGDDHLAALHLLSEFAVACNRLVAQRSQP